MLGAVLIVISVVCLWFGFRGIYRQYSEWKSYRKVNKWTPCGRPDSRSW